MSTRPRRRRRVLFVAVLLVLHQLGNWGLATWDAGNHLLAGGSGRWIAVAAILPLLLLRLIVILVLPSLAAWWAADFLHAAGGAVVDKLSRQARRCAKSARRG